MIERVEDEIILSSESLRSRESEITERLVNLPADEVPSVLWQLSQIDGVVSRLRTVAETRADTGAWTEAVGEGQAWRDPQGDYWEFGPTWKHEVSDPDGLRAALIALAKDRSDLTAQSFIRSAFRMKLEVLQTPLTTISKIDKAYRDVVNDFRKWKRSGTAHLKRVDLTAKKKEPA